DRAIGLEVALAGEPGRDGEGLREIAERVRAWRLLARDTRILLSVLSAELPGLVRDGREEASSEEVAKVLEQLESVRRSVSAAEHLSLSDFLLGLPQSVERGGPGQLHGAVSLLTYHQAKGLEFEVVFLIGLEEGL